MNLKRERVRDIERESVCERAERRKIEAIILYD